jgi:Exopolyphosphatase-related proteins
VLPCNKTKNKKLVKTKSNTDTTTNRENNSTTGKKQNTKFLKEEIPKPIVSGGFNVVLTHCTADFDSLASAVGLAKLWSNYHPNANVEKESTEFQSSQTLPTFVVLPRGAHPSVNKFLALHKHLFPIRSLRSLPSDLSGLNRLGLVDAQKRERVGPAEHLLSYANRVTIVDHHIEGDSDIPEATDYVVDKVGSVSAMIAEQLRDAGLELTEAEATLLALGIHADTGSLCYDSTTVRDVEALAWVMSQGASQAAIAEHAHSTLSQEQQGVLTNALINTNSTLIHGVTVSTALLRYVGLFVLTCLI